MPGMVRGAVVRLIPPPHPDQLGAIRSKADLLFVEAGPGVGKTYVVSERYGLLAFDPRQRESRVVALSFTVSATNVLRSAIRLRWGRAAVRFPHSIQTFDAMFRELLEYLLRAGVVEWPGGKTSIKPIDEWNDRRRADSRNPIEWKPVLRAKKIVPSKRKVGANALVVTARKRLSPQLERGLSTHDSIREIVEAALTDPSIRPLLVAYMQRIASAVVVDELFDANSSDISLLNLAIEAGCRVTAVGDPWQALYDFRHSDPGDVRDELLGSHHFAEEPLTRSFRFRKGSPAEATANAARSGEPCLDLLGSSLGAEVVLASRWSQLWETGPEVQPLAFGQVRTELDAMMAILLDEVVRSRGFSGSRFAAAGFVKLGVGSQEAKSALSTAIAPLLAAMSGDDEPEVGQMLNEVSLLPKMVLEGFSKLRVDARARARYEPLLRAVALRLRFRGRPIPGLTIHQAKGNEWERVAVCFSDKEEEALARGLDVSEADDRRLYVGLTRAREETGRYVQRASGGRST